MAEIVETLHLNNLGKLDGIAGMECFTSGLILKPRNKYPEDRL